MKGIIKKVLLAICVISAPTSVYALPFREDPQSFQNYLNQIKGWDDGSKLYYQNLGKCRSWKIPINSYLCGTGFVTVTNPMGVKVCSIDSVMYSYEERKISQEWGTCRNK